MVIIANIYFSTLDRSETYELPVLPEHMPELSESAKNEEFESIDGVYNNLGNVSLINFSIECFLPAYANKYRWAKSQINPFNLINMWLTAMNNKQPLRIVINRNKREGLDEELLNWVVSVENLSWQEKRNGDVAYKLGLKQYREIN